MGLDMYAYKTSETIAGVVDFPTPDDDEKLHYWRKHPNLHGWMKTLYIEKGGKDQEFNLSAVKLDAADLDKLELAIRHEFLPETSGFFFGVSDGSERDDDLDFVVKARAALKEGYSVYYYAWW